MINDDTENVLLKLKNQVSQCQAYLWIKKNNFNICVVFVAMLGYCVQCVWPVYVVYRGISY